MRPEVTVGKAKALVCAFVESPLFRCQLRCWVGLEFYLHEKNTARGVGAVKQSGVHVGTAVLLYAQYCCNVLYYSTVKVQDLSLEMKRVCIGYTSTLHRILPPVRIQASTLGQSEPAASVVLHTEITGEQSNKQHTALSFFVVTCCPPIGSQIFYTFCGTLPAARSTAFASK